MRVGACRHVVVALSLLVCLLCAFPAFAGADVQTIEFEAVPPVNSPLDFQGDISFPKQLGFRPYRAEVGPGRAHSGAFVGDVGRCVQEAEASGKNPGGCEFFQAQTKAVLARTAKSVSLFVGRFGPIQPGEETEQAVLHAYNASGTLIGSDGPVALSESFDAPLSVTSEAGQIASFRVEATLGPNGEISGPDLGIDDVSVNFAEGGEPDFSVATANDVIALVQGQEVQVPVQVPRINGSNGPIELTVSGLPEGVSAAPVTVPGGQSTATIILVTGPNARDTNQAVTDATIKADPLGNANVGPAPRTTVLSVRVAADFVLLADSAIDVPECAPVDVPLRISRDIAMNRDVSLSLHGEDAAGLPAGVSGDILPDAVVSPGGNLVAERTLRIRVDATASLPESIKVVGEAGGSSHSLTLQLGRLKPGGTIEMNTPGSGLGLTPRFSQPGTPIKVRGSGFCPGTEVSVGLSGKTPANVVNDRTLEFTVPRYATSGPVTVFPPGTEQHYEAGSLTIDSFRNTDAFAFRNYPLQGITLSEFTEAFGADDLFIKVNPCWPFGSCQVVTGILNPIAAIDWGLLNEEFSLAPGSGHCFGIDQAILRFLSGKELYRRFKSGARHAYELAPGDPNGTDNGPRGELDSYLDAMQLRTHSQELMSAWVRRPKSLVDQLGTLAREFSHNRPVDMVLNKGGLDLHTVLAYDMVPTPTGVDIYTSNSDSQFTNEELASGGQLHRSRVEQNVIHVDQAKKTWSFRRVGDLWGGGDDGTLWAIPDDTVPSDPTLPGADTIAEGLAYVQFRSDGVVRWVANPGLALLALIASPTNRSSGAGTLVSRNPDRPLNATFEGLKDGHFGQAYIAPGFVANVSDMATSRGVRDTIKGAGDSITVESGTDRPLNFDLARQETASSTVSATLETHASAEGSDRAGISSEGALAYAHEGAPTTLSFSLTSIRRNGGPATFLSGPVRVGRGDHLRVMPLDRRLRRVRLLVLDARGHRSTRVLRNRGHAHHRLRVGAPRASGRRLSVPFRLAGLGGRAVVGATLRLMRGGHIVARKSVALKVRAGARSVHWRLPHGVGRGRYRLLANLRAVTMGARGATTGGSASARRVATVTVGR